VDNPLCGNNFWCEQLPFRERNVRINRKLHLVAFEADRVPKVISLSIHLDALLQVLLLKRKQHVNDKLRL
jgi:hypothetical protein